MVLKKAYNSVLSGQPYTLFEKSFKDLFMGLCLQPSHNKGVKSIKLVTEWPRSRQAPSQLVKLK